MVFGFGQVKNPTPLVRRVKMSDCVAFPKFQLIWHPGTHRKLLAPFLKKIYRWTLEIVKIWPTKSKFWVTNFFSSTVKNCSKGSIFMTKFHLQGSRSSRRTLPNSTKCGFDMDLAGSFCQVLLDLEPWKWNFDSWRNLFCLSNENFNAHGAVAYLGFFLGGAKSKIEPTKILLQTYIKRKFPNPLLHIVKFSRWKWPDRGQTELTQRGKLYRRNSKMTRSWASKIEPTGKIVPTKFKNEPTEFVFVARPRHSHPPKYATASPHVIIHCPTPFPDRIT